ncbi:MAG: heavy metal translocating P-type ATPase [Candidatus Thiodiazotropha sp.]
MSRSGASDRCFHCNLPIPPDDEVLAPIDGEEQHFCCLGCKAVCEAIYAAGLEGFYDRTPEGLDLAPPPEIPKELALYDLDDVQSEFVGDLGEERDIHLLVEGIHCAACVWLIEHTLTPMPGIVSAQVNLSGKRLHVKWHNNAITLSQIIKRLGEIGYSAVPYDPEAAEGALKKQNRHLLYRMAFAAFGMMNLMWISIALYAGANEGEFRHMFHWIGFALATPVLLYSGFPFYKGAWSGLRNLHLGMDLPIAIGATITYLYSVYITVTGSVQGEVYYDTVVNFMFVILVGRYLEAMSKRQAVAATQRLLDLQPRVATRIDSDGTEKVVPIRAVAIGERIRVKPGERMPVDGVVVEGRSTLDESMLTGESQPVVKTPGESVSAGTINGHGVLAVEVSGLLKNTALGRIIRLVEEAQGSKAPIQCLADQIVPWFVAVTLGLGTLTFLYWFSTDFEVALLAATSVLIITCPCAFGLATPMSIAVASGLGAKYGILVKNGEVLETLSTINHVVFDKTGTLTEGGLSVVAIHLDGTSWQEHQEPSEEILSLMGKLTAIERQSEHPVAASVVNWSDHYLEGAQRLACRNFEYVPGLGITAEVAGDRICIGNEGLLSRENCQGSEAIDARVRQLDEQGVGSFRVAVNGYTLGLVAVEDRIRSDAKDLISALKAEGMQVTLLSGDRRRAAEAIAERLGGMEVIAEVMPEQKDQVIRQLQADGKRVAMVGDGVNDAPALVRADVGIAMGSGTDVSIASADIVLMSSELERVRLAIALSRRTLRTIRQNIGISITYNIIMVPLAMSAIVTPLVAAISMPMSSLAVIGNSARIRTLFRGVRAG